ncbi:MAG: putative RNA methyltransferase [Jatrophihabitans sp.]
MLRTARQREHSAPAPSDPASARVVKLLRIVAVMGSGQALDAVLSALRCSSCAGSVQSDGMRVHCPDGHSFDIARQGYVNLTAGGTQARTGDTAAMVAARERFLATGHYRALADRLARVSLHHDQGAPGLVLDLAGGTGYYLRAVLAALPQRFGACLDLSAPALRRAARSHPRAAAIGADVWGRLPLGDGVASTVLNVFGPRNADEIERVLAPTGTLVVVTPEPNHLQELIEPLGMLTVDPQKASRLDETFRHFSRLGSEVVTGQLRLSHPEVEALVGMGPSAAHATADDQADRIRRLPEPVSVTVAIRISTYTAASTERRDS